LDLPTERHDRQTDAGCSDMCFFDKLPNHVFYNITSHLDIEMVGICMQVCKKWNLMLSLDSAWKSRFYSNNFETTIKRPPPGWSWKGMCLAKWQYTNMHRMSPIWNLALINLRGIGWNRMTILYNSQVNTRALSSLAFVLQTPEHFSFAGNSFDHFFNCYCQVAYGKYDISSWNRHCLSWLTIDTVKDSSLVFAVPDGGTVECVLWRIGQDFVHFTSAAPANAIVEKYGAIHDVLGREHFTEAICYFYCTPSNVLLVAVSVADALINPTRFLKLFGTLELPSNETVPCVKQIDRSRSWIVFTLREPTEVYINLPTHEKTKFEKLQGMFKYLLGM